MRVPLGMAVWLCALLLLPSLAPVFSISVATENDISLVPVTAEVDEGICDISTFKVDYTGKQPRGLLYVSATSQDACAKACCADQSCEVWAWCPQNSLCYPTQSCWIGTLAGGWTLGNGWIAKARQVCSSSSFIWDYPGKQPLGLNRQVAAYTQADCVIACCSDPDCQTFGWCPAGSGCEVPNTCWTGVVSGFKDQPGWVTKSRNANQIASTTPNWVPCATEGGSCTAAKGNKITMFRYGVAPNWNYRFAQNGAVIWCNNDWFGDSYPGPTKTCERKTLDTNSPDISWPSGDSWRWVADEVPEESSYFQATVNRDIITWGFYGLGWPHTGAVGFYFLNYGGGYCQNSWYSDPLPGHHKHCYVSTEPIASGFRLQECADEGMSCNFENTASSYHIMTYGSWPTHMVRMTSRATAPCTTSFFGVDPAYGSKKVCQHQEPSNFYVPTGFWSLFGSGPNTKATLTQSTTRSQSSTKSSEWKFEFSTKVQSNYLFASVETTTTFGISEGRSFTEAIEASEQKTCEAQCLGSDRFIFQWKLKAQEICAPGDISCPIDLGTCHWVCRPNSTPPKCPFDRCNDERCDVCTLAPVM